MDKRILKVMLYDYEAYALATFCRRSVFEHFLACSDGGNGNDEAYDMISAINAIRDALAAMKLG
jgi:hypothetical protein